MRKLLPSSLEPQPKTTAKGPKGRISKLKEKKKEKKEAMLFKSKATKAKHEPPSPSPNQRHPLETAEHDPDLLSRDKARQKEAVKRYLAERVRNDWHFEWPPRSAEDNSASHHDDDTDVAQDADGAGDAAASKVAPSLAAPAVSAEEAVLDGPRIVNNRPGVTSETTAVATAAAPAEVEEGRNQSLAEYQKRLDIVDSNSEQARAAQDTVVPRDSGDEADSDDLHDDDAGSVYSTISEDSAHYRPRLEWSSELSDDEPSPQSPFRFESPDSVGATIRASLQEKKDRRRRAVRDETKWNNGLACFEARRNAWTGAKTVRVRKKLTSPTTPFSPLSPRRFFFRSSLPSSPTTVNTTPSSPTAGSAAAPNVQGAVATSHGQNTTSYGHLSRLSADASITLSDSSDPYSTNSMSKPTSKSSDNTSPLSPLHPVEILLPLASPLLPPANPMRAGITPNIYLSLYDKLVVNGLAPSCPINLSDMIRSCVCGWKRDGEWPPRAAADLHHHHQKQQQQQLMGGVRKRRKRYEEGVAKGSVGSIGGSIGRRMSFGLLGGGSNPKEHPPGGGGAEGEEHGKGIKKSLQRVLGIGHHHHQQQQQQQHPEQGLKSPVEETREQVGKV